VFAYSAHALWSSFRPVGGWELPKPLVVPLNGLAAGATGTVFGLKASSTMDEAKAQCTGSGFKYPSNCSDSSVRSASRKRDWSSTRRRRSFFTGGGNL